jgi:hypothetical protein
MQKLCPFPPVAGDRFCRLLPPSKIRFSCESLRQLALSMCPSPSAKQGRKKPFFQAPAAAHTYLGQFIDHDLVRDDTRLELAGDKEPNETPNPAGGRLDLHHLYGDGPRSRRHGGLYEADGASFTLGKNLANAAGTSEDQPFDFPLDDCGCPVSAEDRNTENLILRQICVLFMKLHNLAVSQGSSFPEARTRTTETYQYIVCHDFLKNVLTTELFERVVLGGDRRIDWKCAGFAVPVEFAQAAFRFGHSMVRRKYQLNDLPGETEILLSDIFGNPQRAGPLGSEKAIDWRSFAAPDARPANLIDTLLAPELFLLPDSQAAHCTIPMPLAIPLPPELALRTLWRGAATRLPTGQEMTNALGVPMVERSASDSEHDPWAKLDELNLLDRIPLWYYVLLEAELSREQVHEVEGVFKNRLGPLGGQLVAEVILGSLMAEDSFVNQHDSDWVPKWTVSTTEFTVDSLAMVARVTGLTSN